MILLWFYSYFQLCKWKLLLFNKKSKLSPFYFRFVFFFSPWVMLIFLMKFGLNAVNFLFSSVNIQLYINRKIHLFFLFSQYCILLLNAIRHSLHYQRHLHCWIRVTGNQLEYSIPVDPHNLFFRVVFWFL